MNEQIASLEDTILKQENVKDLIEKQYETTDKMIDEFEQFTSTEAHKSLVYDVYFNYINDAPSGVGGIDLPNTTPYTSGGFGHLKIMLIEQCLTIV